jgi:hypothetical protein
MMPEHWFFALKQFFFHPLQAYTAYLSGMLRFEHQEWKAAIEAFNKCK